MVFRILYHQSPWNLINEDELLMNVSASTDHRWKKTRMKSQSEDVYWAYLASKNVDWRGRNTEKMNYKTRKISRKYILSSENIYCVEGI